MGNELTLTKREIERISKLDNNALTKFAKEKAALILTRVSELSDRIDEAKSAAKAAKRIKTGLLHWGGTRRKADMSADALTRTNEALAELAAVQQESIMFTCISTRFARVMHQTMAKMMANGFRDTNGNLRELDGNSQEFAQHILDAAEDFTRKQAEVELSQQKQSERIDKVEGLAEDNRRRLAEKDSLDEKQDKGIAEAMALARGNRERLGRKDKLDADQDQAIERNRKEILTNRESGMRRDERIAALDLKISRIGKLPLVLACLSLVVSLLAAAGAGVAIYLAFKK